MTDERKPETAGTLGARTRLVIETLARRGVGSPGDPVRIIQQFWAGDGTGVLLAEVDPETGNGLPLGSQRLAKVADLAREVERSHQAHGGIALRAREALVDGTDVLRALEEILETLPPGKTRKALRAITDDLIGVFRDIAEVAS